MGRRKDNIFRGMFDYIADSDKNQCKMCKKIISGNFLTNLKSHISKYHSKTHEDITGNADDLSLENDSNSSRKKIKKVSIEMNYDILEDSCVNLVTKEGFPFSILDCSSFRRIVTPILDALQTNQTINSHNIINIIKRKSTNIKNHLRKLCSGKIISLKIDIATRLNRSVMGINIQFISNKKIQIQTLAMIELFKSHTAENLKETICQVLQDFGIDEKQIYNITTDNGRNLVKAVQLIGENNNEEEFFEEEADDEENVKYEAFTKCVNQITFNQIVNTRCAAHTLQLAVNDVIRKDCEVQNIISQARTLCKVLRTPIFTQLTSHLKLPKPTLDVPTRWNSSLSMLESLIKYKNFYLAHENLHKKLIFTSKDWKFIEEIIETLEPMKEITMKLQDSQLLMGDFCKNFIQLKLVLQNKQNKLARKIEAAICAREEALIMNDTAVSAMYLDPRISRLLNDRQIDQAKRHLTKLASKYLALKKEFNKKSKEIEVEELSFSMSEESTNYFSNELDHLSTSTAANTSENASLKSIGEKLLADYLENLQGGEETRSEEDSDEELILATREINEFSPKSIPISSDLLEYWEEMNYTKPYLYKLALIIHGSPATQVSVERAFSTLKYILNDYRYKLNHDTLQDILLLKLN